MASARRPLRVGIYGPFGWGNLGDAAIQEAMLANLRRRHPDAEVLAFSLNPRDTEKIHAIESHPIERGWKSRNPLGDFLRELRFLWRAKRRLEGLDLFIISGGGQIADFWGGPFYHPYNLLKWVGCARLAGCRVPVLSVGAGPIQYRLSAFFLQLTLRMSHLRSYRDRQSHELLSKWGFCRQDPVVPDLAFSFPVADRGIPRPAPAPGEPPLVGVGVMAYCHPTPGVWPDHDPRRYRRYLDQQVTLVRGLVREGCRVQLLMTQIRSDRYAFDDLVEILSRDEGGLPSAVRAEPTESLDHALAQIARCDVVVASRLHGVILSFLLHRPVLALSYQQKVDAVVEQFGQEEFRCDIDATTGEELVETVRKLLECRARVGEEIRIVAEKHAQDLERQYDRVFGSEEGGR